MTATSPFIHEPLQVNRRGRRDTFQVRRRAQILTPDSRTSDIIRRMDSGHTTAEVQRYLDELEQVGDSSPADAVIRALLSRSVQRLHRLCAGLLYGRYPRLARGPLNLNPDEMLSAVVERLIKAMREVRPHNVRSFFALANKHMRWELNDLARRLDAGSRTLELNANQPAAHVPTETASQSEECPNLHRILDAIECLPEDERETFNLVRIQGMTHPEAADVLGVSTKTVQRRLSQCVVLLSAELPDLKPSPTTQAPH